MKTSRQPLEAKAQPKIDKSSKSIKIKIERRLKRAINRTMLSAITGVETDQKIAALTFDDGPHPVHTPRLLEILKKGNAKATFFMLGSQAKKYPEIVERVIDEGHAIANHTWAHKSLPSMSSRERRASLRATSKALGPQASQFVRPPFGDRDLTTTLDILSLGLHMVLWDLPSEDWENQSSDQIYERLWNRLAPGRIVLMHDCLYAGANPECEDRSASFSALEKLLGIATQYSFVTLPKLIQRGRPIRRYQTQLGDVAQQQKLVRFND